MKCKYFYNRIKNVGLNKASKNTWRKTHLYSKFEVRKSIQTKNKKRNCIGNAYLVTRETGKV